MSRGVESHGTGTLACGFRRTTSVLGTGKSACATLLAHQIVSDDDAVLHYKLDAFQFRDVLKGIASIASRELQAKVRLAGSA